MPKAKNPMYSMEEALAREKACPFPGERVEPLPERIALHARAEPLKSPVEAIHTFKDRLMSCLKFGVARMVSEVPLTNQERKPWTHEGATLSRVNLDHPYPPDRHGCDAGNAPCFTLLHICCCGE